MFYFFLCCIPKSAKPKHSLPYGTQSSFLLPIIYHITPEHFQLNNTPTSGLEMDLLTYITLQLNRLKL